LPGLARPLTDEWQHEVFFTFQVNVVRDAQSVNARKRMRDKRQKPRARPSGVSAGVHAGGPVRSNVRHRMRRLGR